MCADSNEVHVKYVFRSTMRQDVLYLLDDLAAQERGGITTAEVRKRLKMSEQSASNLMTRLVAAGFLDRVARGVFAPRPLGQLGTRAASQDIALAVAAVFADEPHRIAFRSALDHHGLLVHPARTVQIALPRRVKLERISGRRLQAIHESSHTIAIGSERAGHGAAVSCIERALLESAARPTLVGGWTVLAGALKHARVDPAKLTELASELDAGPAIRRIGSLSEVLGLDRIAASLIPPAGDARVLPLDPQAPSEDPWTDERWRVRWPTSRRDSRELIST
jgi:predicted transcriptional regulator of viral defense system